MSEKSPASSPVPSCEEGLLGIANDRLITDIINPLLMDVDAPRQVTYRRIQALRVSPHKSEYGYPARNADGAPSREATVTARKGPRF